MTLLERCAQIRSKISDLEGLELASKDAERDRLRHDELQPLRMRLQDIAARANVLRQMAVPLASWTPQPKLLAAFQDYCRALDDPENGKRNAYGTLKTALTSLTDTSAELVKKAIDGLAARHSEIDESTLKQFDDIPSLKEKVAATRRKRSEYLAAAAVKNKSVVDLRNFLERRAELLSLTEELKHEHLPREVLEFYRAVHSGKATIGMLNEAIRTWLENHDQLKDLRITLPLR